MADVYPRRGQAESTGQEYGDEDTQPHGLDDCHGWLSRSL